MKLLKTKLAKCLLALFLFLISTQYGSAQNLTINVKNATLESVLQTINSQTGYRFSYSDALGASKIIVKVNVKDVNPLIFFSSFFKEYNIDYRVNGKLISLTKTNINEIKAQIIKGRITDATGEPLAGVVVTNDKTKSFAASDLDGNYSIAANEGDKLSFSLIGMETFTSVVGRSAVINVPMKTDVIALNDVVVTGYQDIQKGKVTGAISTISSKQIEERYTPNIMNNLEGRVAGLSTYGGKTLIRGTSSLYANTQPLLVVDGLPVEGTIEDLNPYDIESINVLKDAAATAIYGARASNGIIVVSTKNAKKSGVIDISFSSNVTVYEKRNLNYSDNFYMNAEQQVKVESDYYDYYFFNNNGEIKDPIGSMTSKIEGGNQQISPIMYAYYQLAKGEITRDDLNKSLENLKKNNFAKEYGDNIYKRQVLQQYNLSLRSKTDKSQNSLIINYKTDNSGIINAEQRLFNINYKGSFNISSWLTASVGINGIYGKDKLAGTDYNASYNNVWSIPAYEKLYNDDGTANKLYYWYNGNPYWSNKSNPNIYDLGIIIKDEYYNNTIVTNRQRMKYHGDLHFKIYDGLTADAQFLYENEQITNKWQVNESSHVAKTIRNAYTTVSNGKVNYLTPRSGGMLKSTNTNGTYWTARGQVNYSKTFGKHAIVAIAGLEFRETLYNGTKSLVLGYDEQLQNSSTHIVDFGGLSSISYSPYYLKNQYSYGYPAKQFVYEPYFNNGMGVVLEQKHRYGSGYANATYTFDDKYNVFGSFRKDYADVYGLNAKFRGKPLWSVGIGWIVSKENFMASLKWLSYLKLRASYGKTGNIYQGATSYITATSTGVNQSTNLPFGEVVSPANPSLKWEQSQTTDIGLDFALLDNRVRGTIDYYNKKGNDIFSNKTLDPSTGFTSMFVNMANMKNKGVELSLSFDWFREHKSGDFSWSTGYTFSYNKNKITHVENPSATASQLISNPYRAGYPTSALWSYKFAGISDKTGEKGETLWYVEDNNAVHDATGKSVDILEYSGQTEPKVIMGMDNRLSWKGVSLSILMAYYGGHKMRALAERETFGVNYSAIASYFVNAWTPENPTSTPGIGRYGSTSIGSEANYSNTSVHSADFIKIRNIVLIYELPEKWIKKLKVNGASLSFQVDNPKYLWVKNKIHVDPETLGLRNPASYIFGLNINL